MCHSNFTHNKKYIGEITGENLIKYDDNINKNMPMRSNFNIKQQIDDKSSHKDFELFDENDINKKIDCFDSGSDYSDVHNSMNKISSQNNPISLCKCGIEYIGFYLLNNMIPIINKSFVINTFSLYNIFGVLYIGSKDNSEIELKNYFSYPDKSIVIKGLSNLISNFTHFNSHIISNNYIIISNKLSYNSPLFTNLKTLSNLKIIDTNNPNIESNLLNILINKLMGKTMKNMVTPDNLHNIDIILLNSTLITPTWSIPFHYNEKGTFTNDNSPSKCNFMVSNGNTYDYYTNEHFQLLELNCSNNNLSMGIVLSKKTSLLKLSPDMIHYYIPKLKSTLLHKVKIPIFQTISKIRYTNFLKHTNLKNVFSDLHIPDLISDNCKLNDVIQNIEIIISNNSISPIINTNITKNLPSFIANSPFIYYFRYIPNNIIIILGLYTNPC